MIDENEDPLESARREIIEEIGYSTSKLELLSTFYTSPGGISERIFLYFTEVTSFDKTEKGGGLESESEDIQLVKIKKYKVKEMLKHNSFIDAKTIVAIQNYFLRLIDF